MTIVKIHKEDKDTNIEAEQDTNLLKLLNRNGYNISNPCSGNGKCGKCKVKVKGLEIPISQEEKKLLGQKSIDDGYRLACFIKPEKNLEVFLDSEIKEAKIMTEGSVISTRVCPQIKKKYVKMGEALLNNPVSDIDRAKAGKKQRSINVLRKLSSLATSGKSDVTLTYNGNRLINIEKGDTRKKLFGIAVDVGTTTIAAYLINLNTGKTEKIYSCLNPQKAYGDDVISRINYTVQNDDGLMELHKSIINCLNDAVSSLTRCIGIDENDIYSMVLTGNTTMLHLAMGINPRRLSISPFIPVTTAYEEFPADSLEIKINPDALVSFLPCVSAYVGADTLCAILGSGMHEENECALIVDIGTNGEIALLTDNRIYSCSVAAGPAFEGANIRNGIGGIEGAVDKVVLTNNVEYTTIGHSKPVGICGSGVIDAIAQLLMKGIIDDTGRILDIEEMPLNIDKNIMAAVSQIEGMPAFKLCQDIYITQKDIREIQNAKAAVAAGIKTLVKHSGIDLKEISKIYLAGGFGSFINVESAIKIGLLPKQFNGRVVACGNAAGTGAIMALISKDCFRRLSIIKEKTMYIELSGNMDFSEFYIDSMIF